jgi:hypothetical protein
MKRSVENNDPANVILYRVYWALSLKDILAFMGFPPSKEAKLILHDFHKRVLGYESIANRNHEVVSRFLAEVIVFWAEQGLFVRTSGRQPEDIQDMDLADCWDIL